MNHASKPEHDHGSQSLANDDGNEGNESISGKGKNQKMVAPQFFGGFWGFGIPDQLAR